MRARVVLGVVVLLILASIGTYAFISAQKPAAASAAATLTIYKGTAQLAPAGSSSFSPVLSGQALNGGDQVRTGTATAAAIRFGDGSITRLDSNTAITILTLTHQGSEYQTGFAQSAGKTWNKVQRLVGLASFNVSGPNSSTAEVRGTTFVLIIEPNGDVRVDDYQGTIIFHAKAGNVIVTTGQSSTLLNGATTPQATTGIPAGDLQDPFTVFNIAADANLDATGNGDILSVNANNTIAVAETQGVFTGGGADGNSDLSFTLDWPGSTFELVIIDPDGVEYDSVVSDQHPVTYTVPKPRSGNWSYQVHDILSDKPKETWSVVVGAVRPAKKTPTLFFRGGNKQVCDHTVIGGKADTWSVGARDAAGVPSLASSQLPDYGTFSSSKGTGTFKFTPPLDVAPADIPITVTATFGGETAAVTCTEHVIPPKKASVGGTVVSGSSGVAGALVTLTMPDASTQIAFSDAAGGFGFSGLGAGNFTVALTVPNGYKASGPIAQTVTLDGNTAGAPVTFNLTPFAISLASLPNGSVGDPSCSVLGLINGVPPVTWFVSSGAMPTGTGIDAFGHCNGTPTTAGTFNFTLGATDANGDTARHAYTVTIFGAPSVNGPGPAIAPIANLLPWDQGFANPQTLTGSGGIAPYSWSVVSGTLPKGLAIGASTGTIDGVTGVNPGSYGATIQLTDAAGAKAYRTVLVSVERAPRFQSSLQVTHVAGVALRSSLYFSYGDAPFSVAASGLPPGITAAVTTTLGESGPQTIVELSGTPTGTGAFTPSITVRDASGGTATLTGSITVIASALAITTPSLPQPTVGIPYAATVVATGGVGSGRTWYDFLPTGLSINRTTGAITGIPTQAGCFPNTSVSVYDVSGGSTMAYPMDVLPAGSGIAICTTSLPRSVVGLAYSEQLKAIGGSGPYAWSLGGRFPASLTVNSATGLLSTATAPNGVFGAGDAPFTWPLTISVTDGSQPTSANFGLSIYNIPDLGPTTLPTATVGASYQGNLPVPTFTLAPTYAVLVSGALPTGLNLTDCGAGQPCLYGTPLQAGPFSFTLAGIDGLGTVSNNPIAYSMTVSTIPITISNPGPNLGPGMVGAAYNSYFSASGGSEPYTWARTGTLPPGLAAQISGGSVSITGKPTAAGTFTSTFQVTDSFPGSPVTASQTYTIVIDPTLRITTTLLPGGNAGQAYSQPIVVSGGSGGNTFGVTRACSLTFVCQYPSNIQIDPNTGVVSTINSPTAGPVTFEVFVDDSDGNRAFMDYTIYFGDPESIVTTSLPNAALKSGYCQSLAARGGSPAYTWSLSAGALPTGVALDAYGHLTGTPTVAGAYNFTVMATDTVGAQATQSYTVTIS